MAAPILRRQAHFNSFIPRNTPQTEKRLLKRLKTAFVVYGVLSYAILFCGLSAK